MDNDTRTTAQERVRTLFNLAKATIHHDPSLAQRYASLARKVAMAGKIRLPEEYRRQICIKCGRFMVPGINSRVRLRQQREPHVIITCLDCKKHSRIPIKRMRKENGP